MLPWVAKKFVIVDSLVLFLLEANVVCTVWGTLESVYCFPQAAHTCWLTQQPILCTTRFMSVVVVRLPRFGALVYLALVPLCVFVFNPCFSLCKHSFTSYPDGNTFIRLVLARKCSASSLPRRARAAARKLLACRQRGNVSRAAVSFSRRMAPPVSSTTR